MNEFMNDDYNYPYSPLHLKFQSVSVPLPVLPHPQPWGNPRGSLGYKMEEQAWQGRPGRGAPPALCLGRLDRAPMCWQALAPLYRSAGFLFELGRGGTEAAPGLGLWEGSVAWRGLAKQLARPWLWSVSEVK